MAITVNGKQMELFKTVQQLLVHYRLENCIVIVEVNEDIVMKENYETTSLSHGDVVEIVHFVGGG